MNWRLLHTLVLWTILIGAHSTYLSGQCSISISDNNPCSGAEISIGVDDPVAGSDYSWDLDNDGQVDVKGSVFFDYAFPETYTDRTFTITLFRNGSACSSMDVPVTAGPDASIGIANGAVTLEGNELKACSASGSLVLEIFNASTTVSANEKYTINWGDGSPPETHTNSSFSSSKTISHTYNSLGYFPMFVSIEHENGCVYTRNYTLYNGGNPSVGLANPGNTVGLCAPATLTFPITNTENNPPGTEYTIFINGVVVATYDQDNLPDEFTYTFEDPSCGINTSTGNYQNAFDLKIVASNPCNSSAATIEPIEVSTPPEPIFTITEPAYSCDGSVYGFSNASTNVNEVLSGSPSSCVQILSPNWTISGTDGEDWEVVDGNLFNANDLGIRFLKPGTYTVEMTIVSFSCGESTFSQEITIYEQPEIDVTPQLVDVGAGPGGEPCSPYKFDFTSTSKGNIFSYTWKVDADQDWEFINGTSSNTPNASFIFYGGGDYRVTLSAVNSCTTISWDTLITLQGRPTAVLDIPDFCDEAQINFDNAIVTYGNNGYSIDNYDWTFEGANNITTSTEANPSGIRYDQPGEYVVRLRTSNTCGSVTVRDTFAIQPKENMTLPPDEELCVSADPITLSAGLSGGKWSGKGVTPAGTFNPANANIGANELTYTFGSGVCLVEESMTVTVNPLPEIVLQNEELLCKSSGNIRLQATPEGGTWTSLNGAVIEGDRLLVNETPAGTYRFRYDVMDENGCATSDSVSIKLKDGPAIAISDTSYCNSAKDQKLPFVPVIGGTWTGPGVTQNGRFNPFAAGGAGEHQLTYIYQHPGNGCVSEVPVVASVVDPIHVDAGGELAICEDSDIILLDSLATPPGGRWFFEGQRMDLPLFDPDNADNGIYKFAYRVGDGVCTVRDTLVIEIADQEVIDIGDDESVCTEAEEIRLKGTNGLNGIWSGQGIVDSLNGFFDPAGLEPGEYEVRFMRQDDDLACPGEDSKMVRVLPQPTPDFDLPSSVCINNEFSTENKSEGANSYFWDFGDGATSTATSASHQYTAFGKYPISLSATNDLGCTAIFVDSIEVAPPPNSSFDLVNDEGCGPLTLEFNNTSSGADMRFEWDFGNGQTSDREIPIAPVIYQTNRRDTSYVITLRTFNGCGSDISRDTILVHPFPLANFGFSVDTGCAPVNVTFANISLGSPESYSWDFGNGFTSTDRVPAPQVFTAGETPSTYDITLIAANACGADTLVKSLVVYPEEVQAFLNLDNEQGCAPYTLELESFSNTTSYVAWDFGDGQTGGGDQVSHTYSEPGEYTVKLNVGNGCREDSTSAVVRVLPSPNMSFAHSPNLCTEQEVFFNNDSGPLANLLWNFGDGTTSNIGNPIHTFPSTGTYTVTLSGSIAESGCADTLTKELTIIQAPQAQIQGVDLEGCAPYNSTFSADGSIGDFYTWDFGDGNTSNDAQPTHMYVDAGNYTVQLTVSDMQGCEADTILSGITVFPSPIANFSIPSQICGLPAELVLNNLSSGADDFQWTFSNGMQSELRSPAFTFDENVSFSIELVSGNQFGCADTIQRSIDIRDQGVADFILDPGEGCDPLPVTFTNYSNGNQFLWDFGDGGTSTEQLPTHTYLQPGTYNVRLISSFDGICGDTLQIDGQVNVMASPFADFDWVPVTVNGQTSRTINFVNQSEDAVSYFWDFGDGTTTGDENPSHTYENSQAWQVLLEATNSLGCTDDTLLTVEPSFIGRLYVPNAFAPEQGVGEAQLFLPKGLGIKEYQLQIFSPYGELLWQSTTLENGQPAEGWDGTHNGNLLPQDVYVWKIKAIFEDGSHWMGTPTSGGGYKRLGSVTLIR